jgi:AraC-like DNA-binding protein
MFRSRFSKPTPGLSQFIRFYVQREVRNRGAFVAHPVPARATPMIVFEFGDPIEVLYCNQLAPVTSPGVVVVGPQTYRRLEMHLRGALETFAIMFQPDGLHRLFSTPMQELTNLDYEAHSVLGSFIARVRERLGNLKSFTQRVRLLDEVLLQRALASTGFDGVSAAANRIIVAGGRADIPALAGSAGLSMRQFERRFTQQVGVRPKLFARIARFEVALEGKARFVRKSWTDVAHEFGYYDQMHMVHDFAEFTGATPSETLTHLETIFVEEIETMRPGGPRARDVHNARLIL